MYKLYNYFFDKKKYIELYPDNIFSSGNSYISILQKDGIDYIFKKNNIITNVKYIKLNDIVSYDYFDLLYKNQLIFSNKLFNNKIIDETMKIIIDNDSHIIISLTNTKLDLPIKVLPKFKIIIEFDENNMDNCNIEHQYVNSTVYNNFEIEKYGIDEKTGVGLCFSGGGGRSFSSTLGYIRALRILDLLNKTKYVSCISGSTWIWIPYIFNKKIDENKFIGLDVFGDMNIKLNNEIIKYTNKMYIADGLINLSYNFQLIEYIYDSYNYFSVYEKSRIWSYVIGCIFLKPFGMMDYGNLCVNEKYKNLFKNEPYNINNIDFNVAREDLPFLLVSSNIIKSKNKKTLTNTDFNLFIFTPLYCGCLSKFELDMQKNNIYGGELMNTYSFHGLEVKKINNDNIKNLINVDLNIDHKQQFKLFDIMGSSSTAYGIIADYLGIYNINPSYRINNSDYNKMNYINCVDGGVLDNMGIIPLLQRKTKKIISFINTSNKIEINQDDNIMTKSIDICLRQLFLGKMNIDKIIFFDYFEYINDLQIFDDKLWKDVLMQLRYNIEYHNIALIELNNIKTIQNENLNICEYEIEKLVIIYLTENDKWKNERLENDIKLPLNFPYYNTIFDNCGYIDKELLQLDASHINLLSDMCCFTLLKNDFVKNIINKIYEV